MRLKVTRKGHNRIERAKDGMRSMHYAPGDTFTGTERELRAFGDRLEKVEEPKRRKAKKKEPVRDESEQADSAIGN